MKIQPNSLYFWLSEYLQTRKDALSSLRALQQTLDGNQPMRSAVIYWVHSYHAWKARGRELHASYLRAVRNSWHHCSGLMDQPGHRPSLDGNAA